jgi:hypothetical protein
LTIITSIVEGDGEVAALPILLRRLSEWLTPGAEPHISHPIRVRRDRFLNRPEEFRRHLLLAAGKCTEQGWILVLLDADDICPAEYAPQILQRAQALVPHRRLSLVFANREYEAWFIAAAASLNGHRGFVFREAVGFDPEQRRDAKGWLRERMIDSAYRERTDQPAFTATMDLPQVHQRSRSFRKLCDEWSKHMRP